MDNRKEESVDVEREIGYTLEGLEKSDVDFIMKQFRNTANYLKRKQPLI